MSPNPPRLIATPNNPKRRFGAIVGRYFYYFTRRRGPNESARMYARREGGLVRITRVLRKVYSMSTADCPGVRKEQAY
jgi:hypothetical protein